MKLIEVTIILITILMVLGLVLTSMENANEKVMKTQEINNMEKLTSEVVDNLINNPGIPDNWYEHESGTPGLAIVNDGGQVIPNSVSYTKFVVLGKNYNKLIYEKLFDSKIHSSLELNPHKSSISSVKIGESEKGNNIYSINRLVKCDFFKSYVLKNFQNMGKCNKHHNPDKCSCNYFKVFPGNLRKSDFYLLIDDDENYDLKYFVDTTRVVKDRDWETPDSDTIYLNDKIDFYDDNSAVVFVHLNKPHAKAVLVSVPKSFDKSYLDYDYFRTNDCELRLTAWY